MEKVARILMVGEEIPSLTKTAFMPIDPEARNVIHTDDYAKRFGLRGALVGGPSYSATYWRCYTTTLAKSGYTMGR